MRNQQEKGEWDAPEPMSGIEDTYIVLDAGRPRFDHFTVIKLQNVEKFLTQCWSSSIRILVNLSLTKETSHLIQVHIGWMREVE